MSDLACPEGLSRLGRAAHARIIKVLEELQLTSTGGCRAFYSPAEWKDRGEEYGTGSELIVTYDGGDLRYFFSMDAGYETGWRFTERMRQELEELGLYSEECTCWYSAIYTI